jgi:hypothetical protein
MLILHLADVELKWSIIHSTPPFLECIVAYYATSLYKTGYGSLLVGFSRQIGKSLENLPGAKMKMQDSI